MADSSAARARWELENDIQADDVDNYYQFNLAEQQALQQQKPWAKDPNYFKQYAFYTLPAPLLQLIF